MEKKMARRKTEQKKEKADVKFKDLQSAAKEVNKIFSDGDQIKTVGIKSDKLVDALKEAGQDLDPEKDADSLSAETIETMKAIGVDMSGFEEDPKDLSEGPDDGSENEDLFEIEEGPDYAAVAEELNNLLGFEGDDCIDVELEDDELVREIKEVCENDIKADEFKESDFSDEALQIFSELKIEIKFKEDKIGGRKGGRNRSKSEKEKSSGSNKKSNSKAEKTAKKGPSAYATMLDILCDEPSIDKDEFRKRMDKTKMDYKDTAFNTAFSSCQSIFKRLKDNKLLKK